MIFDHMIVYFTSAVGIKLNIELDIFFWNIDLPNIMMNLKKKMCNQIT